MASTVGCRSIPSINTLSTPWVTLDWHSINISVDGWLIFDWCTWVSRHLADYQLTVDQVSIECRPHIDWDVHQVPVRCWSRALIDTLLPMPLVHMIQSFFKHQKSLWEDKAVFFQVPVKLYEYLAIEQKLFIGLWNCLLWSWQIVLCCANMYWYKLSDQMWLIRNWNKEWQWSRTYGNLSVNWWIWWAIGK